MTEFQELVKDAPKFVSMERGELVAYAYAMYASGAKMDAENAKLRELLHNFLCEHADYFAEGNYYIGDLDLEHAMHHNQAFFRREAKKLGVEVDG